MWVNEVDLRQGPDNMCGAVVDWLAWLWKAWKVFWSVLGPVGNTAQWLFGTRESFFLFVERTKYWLLNSTTWWNASFQFDLPEGSLETLPSLLSQLAESLRDQEGFRVFRDLPENKTVRAGGVVFEFDCHAGFLHVQISDQKISFRDSRRLIEFQLFPLLEKIESALGSCSRQYSLTAKFGSTRNPYLSTHLARVNKSLIIVFECSYNLGRSPDSAMVSIHKDSVSIVARSREQFRNASLRVLALSRP